MGIRTNSLIVKVEMDFSSENNILCVNHGMAKGFIEAEKHCGSHRERERRQLLINGPY
jgi:hypothetical protein